MDPDLGAHRLLHEVDDIGRRNPGRTQPSGDIRRAKVGGLHRMKRTDVSIIGGIEAGGGFRNRKLCAHGAGEIGVGGLP
ncbi:hypothetical protein D3C71_2168300 [compost metagenome]